MLLLLALAAERQNVGADQAMYWRSLVSNSVLRTSIACVAAATMSACAKRSVPDASRSSPFQDGEPAPKSTSRVFEHQNESGAIGKFGIRQELKRGAAFSVTADLERVRLRNDAGSEETILWSLVRRISVLTTDEGPRLTDVFINLEGDGSRLVVPQDARDNQAFVARLLKINGFDLTTFAKAMGSSENAEFQCWAGTTVAFRGD